MTAHGEILALFGDATVRQRLCLAAIVSGFLGLGAWGCSYVGTVMGNMVPVKRAVITKRVVRTEYLSVPRAPRVAYPALKDPQEACTGAPVVINKLVVAGTIKDKDAQVTWLTVRPVGDDYLVYCQKGGSTGDMWHEGDLIRLYGGQPA